mmetsp:Transcript_9825/g.33305  ORF Transcript_9825/g.33305 Transcript_9825/m.33305 type:complete len:109 (+) Transcript_9825:222-548(+)
MALHQLAAVQEQTLKHLADKPAAHYTHEQIQRFVEGSAPFGLSRRNIQQILDILPLSTAELGMIVAGRDDAQLQQLLGLMKDCFAEAVFQQLEYHDELRAARQQDVDE